MKTKKDLFKPTRAHRRVIRELDTGAYETDGKLEVIEYDYNTIATMLPALLAGVDRASLHSTDLIEDLIHHTYIGRKDKHPGDTGVRTHSHHGTPHLLYITDKGHKFIREYDDRKNHRQIRHLVYFVGIILALLILAIGSALMDK